MTTTRTPVVVQPRTPAELAAHWQRKADVYRAAGETKRANDCAQIAREFAGSGLEGMRRQDTQHTKRSL